MHLHADQRNLLLNLLRVLHLCQLTQFFYYRYDTWSVGVVFLELILGSPNVFQINSLTRALLDQHLKGWNEELKELANK